MVFLSRFLIKHFSEKKNDFFFSESGISAPTALKKCLSKICFKMLGQFLASLEKKNRLLFFATVFFFQMDFLKGSIIPG